MSDEDRVLSDSDVCRILGRKSVGKLELLLTDDGIYERDVDGRWHKLSSEPAK